MNLGLKNKNGIPGDCGIQCIYRHVYDGGQRGICEGIPFTCCAMRGEEVTVSAIADALDHTEADVKRALAYWEEAGLLGRRETEAVRAPPERGKGSGGGQGCGDPRGGKQLRPYGAPFRG